ncbi:MAG: DNA replication/repair protein RecF [Alphaproteobacteria bacterium]
MSAFLTAVVEGDGNFPPDRPAGNPREDAPRSRSPVPSRAGKLWVRRLMLTEFRSYRSLELDLTPRAVVLTGPNGAGKTNLLEALSFLTPGRGLRQAQLTKVARIGPGEEQPGERCWAVAARLETPTGEVDIGTGRDPAARTGRQDRRIVHVDGAPQRGQAALTEHLGIVWLTPEMDRLFQNGSAGRRRFLDRLVYGLDRDHPGRVASYEHLLRERARLLRDRMEDEAWLDALERRLAEKGVAIAAARREAVTRLDELTRTGAVAFPGARLALAGDVDRWLDEAPALAVEDRLHAALTASRAQDAETFRTAHGPHRSDLLVRHLGIGAPAERCSTGEQKALLIGLVLAQVRLLALARGAPPLLLLDEVGAHLDVERRAALFDLVAELGAQAWMTGTDRSLFEGLGDRAQYFDVRNSTLKSRGSES